MPEPGEPNNHEEELPDKEPKHFDPMKDTDEMQVLTPQIEQQEKERQEKMQKMEKEYNDLLLVPRRSKEEQERFEKLYKDKFGKKYKG